MSQHEVGQRLGKGHTVRRQRSLHLRTVAYGRVRVRFRDGWAIAVSTSGRGRSVAGVTVGTTERAVRRRLPGLRCVRSGAARRCTVTVPGRQTTVRLKRGRVASVQLAEACGAPLASRPAGPNAFPPPRTGPAPADAQAPGFETGDFSQWDQLDGNLGAKDRYFKLLRRPAPVFEGRYSFQSTVDSGAVDPREAGQRTMVLVFPSRVPSSSRTRAYEGAEAWYRTHVYFPRSYKPSPDNGWNFVAQWHNWPDGVCCPNVILSVDTSHGCEALSLRAMGGGDARHPVERSSVIEERNPAGQLKWFVGDPTLLRDHWYDSVVHVKWSYLASRGYVEWWLDGHLIASQSIPTLYWYDDDNSASGRTPGPGQAYYMEGLYRPAKLPDGRQDTSSASVIMDGARWGATRSAVE
jgi:hypothetical protein